MPTLITNSVQIERFANALYGVAVGSSTMAAVNADIVSNGGLTNTLNNYYSNSFGSSTTASVAATIVANVGIVAGNSGLVAADVTNAVAYVKGILDAATPGARGAAVTSILNTWGSFTADKTYGAAATTWNALVDNAIAYSQANFADVANAAASTTVSNAATAAAAAATAAASAVVATPLTVGTDTIVATKNALTVSGTAGVSTTGAQPTFTAGDSITGLAGVTTNALNVTDQTTGGTWTPTSLGGVSISGIQNVTFSSGEAVTADTTSKGGTQGYTGLTSLGVYGSGGLNVTSAGTVTISATDSAAAATSETISGGKDINLTVNGITTGGRITVGSATAAPLGNVTVNTAMNPSSAASNTSDAITITGGQVVTVNETTSTPPATIAAGYTNTGGSITVTGQLPASASNATATNSNPTGTTSVSATQSKVAPATYTVNLTSASVTGAAVVGSLAGALTVATVTDGTNTLTLTNGAAVAAGVVVTYSAAQIAQAIAAFAQGSGTLPLPTNNLFGTGSTLISDSWSTGGQAAFGYGVGAPAAGSPLLTFTNVTTAGVARNTAPTINNNTPASIATVVAATGGVYDGVVTASDANGTSTSLASTLSTVTLNGLSFDTNTIGTVINSSALQNLSISNASSGAKVTINNNLIGTTNTTLNLSLNAALLSGNLIDTNSELTTLNITATGTGTTGVSRLDTISNTFGNVTTMTVKGTGAIRLGGLSGLAKLNSLSISGGSAVQADVSGNALITSLTDTGTGQQVITIDPRTQSFNGAGSGQDIVTIQFPATATVAAGSNANNILVWNAAASPSTLGNVTGFTNLYLGSSSTGGTFNMATIGSAFTGLGIVGGATTTGATFTNVNPGTSLAIDSSVGVALNAASTGIVNYQTTGTTGASNTANITLGISATDPRVTAALGAATATKFGATIVGTLNMTDSSTIPTAANGVGTVNISSNASAIAQAHTISTLGDIGLKTLNLSGTAATVITSLTESATSLAITNNSTSTAYSTIGTLTDYSLTNLSFAGTGFTGYTAGSFPVPAAAMTLVDASSSVAITDSSVNPVTFTAITGSSAGTSGPGISTLTIGGSTAITARTLTLTGATESIINNAPATFTVSSLGDAALSTLTIGGTGPTTITTMDGVNGAQTIINSASGVVQIAAITGPATGLTLMNNGSGTFTVAANGLAAGANTATLASMTLVGNVGFTDTGLVKLATVNAPSDNANVSLTLTANTASGLTPLSFNLGNGNNTLSYTTTLASVNANFGTGSNTVTIAGAVPPNKVDTFTFGTHTGGGDNLTVSLGGADFATVAQIVAGTSTANSLIAGDTITFAAAAGVNLTTIPQFVGAPTSNLAITIGAAATTTSVSDTGALGSITSQYGVASFVYGGNTYVVEKAVAQGAALTYAAQPAVAASTEVIQIIGVHTLSNMVNGTITLLT